MGTLCEQCQKNVCLGDQRICTCCQKTIFVETVSNDPEIKFLLGEISTVVDDLIKQHLKIDLQKICSQCGFIDVFLPSEGQEFCQCCGQTKFISVDTVRGQHFVTMFSNMNDDDKTVH